jgi:iron complex transport system permease protein
VGLALPLGRSLNVLARGPMQAAVLGVSVYRLEWAVYLLAAVVTAAAVTTAGTVGFVGLIVPHMLRLVIGNDQRLLIPAAALAGGILLTLADTVARTAIAPQQLPVGVITAMLGVPLFLFLLYRSRT